MNIDFSGKSALVIGGASGIGNGIARAFLGCGAKVHVWGTRPSAADYADDPFSDLSGLVYAPVDATDPKAVDAGSADISEVDILVQSQGMVLYKRAEYQRDGWSKVTAVNLDSVIGCATAFHDKLAARQGAMIIISSTSAYRATIGNPAYAASKAGAVSLVRTLGKAWAPQGIRVNGIAPGYVDTKLTAVTTRNPERLANAVAGIAAGRLGTPEDMAGVALFLASPLASYIYGQTIIVDGGITL